MANILAELVAEIVADTSGLVFGLNEADRKLKESEANLKSFAQNAQKIGAVMVGVGAAITGSLALMTKAAIDEEININRLSIALKGVGIQYDSVKDKLEGVLKVTQRKTGIADDQQRDVLGRLILVTKDYNKALSLLPLALDLAAAGQMDASTAATYLSKAYLELENGADQIGIRIGQATVNFKNLEEVQKLVGGAAEAAANPLNVLKATIGDLAEQIGAVLVPILKSVVNFIVPIIEKIQVWIQEHPALTKALVIATAALGGFLLVVGTVLVALAPLLSIMSSLTLIAGGGGLIAALGGVAAAIAAIAGPALLVIGIIAALAAIVYLVITNWESIVNFFKNLWNTVVSIFKENWNIILSFIFPWLAIPLQIIKHWDAIVSFFRELPEKIKSFFAGLADHLKAPFITAINWIVDKINWLIQQINKVSPWDIGLLGKVGASKPVAGVTGMAQGGIVSKPTLAMLGENFQPEAVVPLSAGNLGGGNSFYITIEASGLIESESTLRQIGEKIYDYIIEKDRRATSRAI